MMQVFEPPSATRCTTKVLLAVRTFACHCIVLSMAYRVYHVLEESLYMCVCVHARATSVASSTQECGRGVRVRWRTNPAFPMRARIYRVQIWWYKWQKGIHTPSDPRRWVYQVDKFRGTP